MQIKILSLSDCDDGIKIVLSIVKDEKRYKKSLTITEDDYSAIGSPSVDEQLSESAYKALKRRTKKTGAIDDSLRILSFGDNNRASLKRKLTARGYDSSSIDAAIEKMCELGYINEPDQAYRYVISLANNKKIGPKRIYPYLISRGYKKEDIDNALRKAIDDKEIDFSKIKSSLILKYRPENEEEEKALLFRHGFYSSDFDI